MLDEDDIQKLAVQLGCDPTIRWSEEEGYPGIHVANMTGPGGEPWRMGGKEKRHAVHGLGLYMVHLAASCSCDGTVPCPAVRIYLRAKRERMDAASAPASAPAT